MSRYQIRKGSYFRNFSNPPAAIESKRLPPGECAATLPPRLHANPNEQERAEPYATAAARNTDAYEPALPAADELAPPHRLLRGQRHWRSWPPATAILDTPSPSCVHARAKIAKRSPLPPQ